MQRRTNNIDEQEASGSARRRDDDYRSVRRRTSESSRDAQDVRRRDAYGLYGRDAYERDAYGRNVQASYGDYGHASSVSDRNASDRINASGGSDRGGSDRSRSDRSASSANDVRRRGTSDVANARRRDARGVEYAQVASQAGTSSYSRGARDSRGLDASAETPAQSKKEQKKSRPKMSTGRKVLIAVLSLFLIAVAAVGVFAVSYLGKISDSLAPDIETQEALSNVLSDVDLDEPFYMLLIGSDKGKGREGARADTLILCRIDATVPQVTMVSMMRDTMIEIEGYGICKLNASYTYGGAAGAIEAVEELAGVDIAHYAEVSFTGLEDVVDAIGGIEVDVPVSFSQKDNTTGETVYLEAGEQTLDGQHALALCRERHSYVNQDFGRTEAQRLVLTAMLKKVSQMSLTSYPALVEQIAEAIETDLSVSDILSLASEMRGISSDHIYTTHCPSGEEYIDGVSYLAIYEDEWAEMMSRIDAGLSPEDTSEEDVPEETVDLWPEDDIKPLASAAEES